MIKDINRKDNEPPYVTDKFEIICAPGSPSKGVRAAMIKHRGALIELIEFNK